MSDYRNQPLKFASTGLELNQPPENLPDFAWRKLDNVKVITEGILEARPHTIPFFSDSSLFTRKTFTWSDGGADYEAIYPDSYYLGPLVYISWVGKLKSGEDAFLTIHQAPGQTAWPYEIDQNDPASKWSCFLNGIPITEVDLRNDAAVRPPLTLSSEIPTVVRILSPNGPTQVIIDGRWKIFPSEIDFNNPPTDWYNNGVSAPDTAGGQHYVLAYNQSTALWTNRLAPSGTIKQIPAFRVGLGIEPYGDYAPSGTELLPQAIAGSTTTVGPNGDLSGSYTYKVTYRNKIKGTRSIASGASAVITVTTTITNGCSEVDVYYPLDPQDDQIEIWRQGGTIGDSYRLVTTQDDDRSNIEPGTSDILVYIDTMADLDISLNEKLDTTLVKPFPTVDIKGEVYSLLRESPSIYNVGLVTVTQSSTVVQAYGTVSETSFTPPAWTADHVGYYFYGPQGTAPYVIKSVTAATTATGAQLGLSSSYQQASAAFTNYMISRDWVHPVAFGPFLGSYVFWIGDPVKKNAFYWNIASKIDLSTADANFGVINDPGEELVNGFIYGGLPYIFSKRKLYGLDFGNPSSGTEFVPREIPIGVGLAGKHAFASSKMGVVFMSWDGIYVTDCGGGPPQRLSENLNPLFRGEDVADYKAINWTYADSARIFITSRDIHFFYKVAQGGTLPPTYEHLVYDYRNTRWSRWNSAYKFNLAYELENLGYHAVVFGGEETDDAYFTSDAVALTSTESFTCTARTGSWDSGVPLTDKEFGVLLLDFDPDGAEVTITPRYNSDTETGTAFTAGTSGDTNGRRTTAFSLTDKFRRSLSLEFSWTDTGTAHPKFYQATMLFRVDEEAVKHWHIPPTALGQQGQFQIKDSYWTLKNSAPVTLTVTVDGKAETYTITDTGTERQRHYVELKPYVGKLFSFSLDSTAAFYFYGEDSGLLGKGWKSSTGYQILSPFSAAGYAQYLRSEGGT